jgi:hypothetical protein
MNAKLIIEGKEFDIEILDPKLQELIAPTRKTGYERVGEGENFYYSVDNGTADYETEYGGVPDDETYADANYYSDETVAENNARAEKLIRQLRRFAVEHRTRDFEWTPNKYYFIGYNQEHNELEVRCAGWVRLMVLYFDSSEITQLAIDTFHDELVWYFTEYKDSL